MSIRARVTAYGGLGCRTRRDHFVRWLSFCGFLAPVLLLSLYVAASLLNPGFNHIGRTVSRLGVEGVAHPEVMNSGFIMFGVLMILFPFGLYMRFENSFMAKLLWLMLALCGLGVLLVGVFRVDPLGTPGPRSIASILHAVFASMSILSLVVGMLAAADIFRRYPAWHGFVVPSVFLAAVILSLVVLFMAGAVDQWAGLCERLFYTIAFGWIWVVGLKSFLFPYTDEM
jgi:hypothetical membrane protein